MKLKKATKAEVTLQETPKEKKTNKRMTKRQLIEEQIEFYEHAKRQLGDNFKSQRELDQLRAQLTQSKRGKGAKQKGASYERHIADLFKEQYGVELKRTPQSGGFAKKSEKANDFRGDIIPITAGVDMRLHIECKNQKTWNLKKWLQQATEDCPAGKIPVVVMKKENTNKVGQAGNQQDLVVIDLKDLMTIVPKDKIFTVKKG